MSSPIRLFVYGSLLPGEPDAPHLEGASYLGPASTSRGYRLVELESFPALIQSGDLSISGELYELSREQLGKLDQLKENGRLFLRKSIELSSGETAESFLMDEDKLRGRRRLRATDWRKRFAPPGRGGTTDSVFGSWRR